MCVLRDNNLLKFLLYINKIYIYIYIKLYINNFKNKLNNLINDKKSII